MTNFTLTQKITQSENGDAVYVAEISNGKITGTISSVHANCDIKHKVTHEKILPYRGASIAHGIVEKEYDEDFILILKEMGGTIGSGEGKREEIIETMERFQRANGSVQAHYFREDMWEICQYADTF